MHWFKTCMFLKPSPRLFPCMQQEGSSLAHIVISHYIFRRKKGNSVSKWYVAQSRKNKAVCLGKSASIQNHGMVKAVNAIHFGISMFGVPRVRRISAIHIAYEDGILWNSSMSTELYGRTCAAAVVGIHTASKASLSSSEYSNHWRQNKLSQMKNVFVTKFNLYTVTEVICFS